MLSLAKRQSGAKSFAMECLQAGAESMPLADSFADTAVVAYALWGVLVWLSVHADGWVAVARGTESLKPEILDGVARVS